MQAPCKYNYSFSLRFMQYSTLKGKVYACGIVNPMRNLQYLQQHPQYLQGLFLERVVKPGVFSIVVLVSDNLSPLWPNSREGDYTCGMPRIARSLQLHFALSAGLQLAMIDLPPPHFLCFCKTWAVSHT